MSKTLIVTSSAQGEASVSDRLAHAFDDSLRAAYRNAIVTFRDLGRQPLPHLVPDTVAGVRGEPKSEAELATSALSHQLIAELQDADLIVIASPMYNFGISSTLKAWFDHVLRPRVTFSYSEKGPEGLIKGKRAIVIISRAGAYQEGGMDFQVPHLRAMLNFMGIEDVTFVRAEALAFGPEKAAEAVAGANETLRGIAEEQRALAA